MYEIDTTELRKAMVEKGMFTSEALSVASGVNRNTISEVVNGKTYPSTSVMARIGTALGFNGSEMGRIFFKEKLASDASN